MTLKLYYDLMSQPSRAMYILLKTIKCNFTPQPVDLRKGEHFSEAYTAINRFQRVPVIDNNGFILTESVAIIKYLARENIIPESLYPKDVKAQARVEEFLEWQHTGIRLHCAMYFRVKYLDVVISGKPPNPHTLDRYENRMQAALENFDHLWLGQGNQFITGNTITVADLFAACELEQPRMAGFDPSKKYTNIAVWWDKVRHHFSPYYQEAHVIVNKIVAKQNRGESKL